MAEAGSTLGEMALIADTRRLTSAEAATDAEVLRINRSMFRRILEEYPETAEALRTQIIEDLQALIRKIEQVASGWADTSPPPSRGGSICEADRGEVAPRSPRRNFCAEHCRGNPPGRFAATLPARGRGSQLNRNRNGR